MATQASPQKSGFWRMWGTRLMSASRSPVAGGNYKSLTLLGPAPGWAAISPTTPPRHKSRDARANKQVGFEWRAMGTWVFSEVVYFNSAHLSRPREGTNGIAAPFPHPIHTPLNPTGVPSVRETSPKSLLNRSFGPQHIRGVHARRPGGGKHGRHQRHQAEKETGHGDGKGVRG